MMKKRLNISLIFIFLLFQLIYPQRVGLVLSGGAAKGIAHIGVIQALEEKEIPIDYIAGTSMGAIIGSMYAMGYTPQEMMEFISQEEFTNVVSTKKPNDFLYYFKMQEVSPEFINFNLSFKDTTYNFLNSTIPQSIMDPNPMNFIFMKSYSADNVVSGGDFNKLFVPFRCIASDIFDKKPIIFKHGDLGNAVRASMTFPLVFKPIIIDSIAVFDGGIYNNFPVDIVEEDFAPDFIIGSSVARVPKKKYNPNINIYNQLENIVTQKTNYTIEEEKGAVLNIDLSEASLFDFNNIDYIYRKGYEKGLIFADSLLKRIDRRVPAEVIMMKREAYKAKKPPLIFDSYTISGGNTKQNLYISKMFRTPEREGVTCDDIKTDFYKTLSDNNISELVLNTKYHPDRERYTLNIKALMQKNFKASIGGFITSMNSNQIYLGLKYRQLGQFSSQYNLSGELGRTYNGICFNSKLYPPGDIPLYFQILYVLQQSKFYDYESFIYSGENASFVDNGESYIKLNIGFPMLKKSKGIASIGYGYLNNKYFNTFDYNSETTAKERHWSKLLRAAFIIDKNSLNNPIYPTSGSRLYFKGAFYSGKNYWKALNMTDVSSVSTNHWFQFLADYECYLNVNRYFKLGTRIQASISTRQNDINYLTSIVLSPGFTPTPYSKSVFNSEFHEPKYIVGGIMPIVKFSESLYIKNENYCFLPINKIYSNNDGKILHKNFFSSCSVSSETTLVYSLPFTKIGLFANYSSNKKLGWSFGLNIGYLIHFPSFY